MIIDVREHACVQSDTPLSLRSHAHFTIVKVWNNEIHHNISIYINQLSKKSIILYHYFQSNSYIHLNITIHIIWSKLKSTYCNINVLNIWTYFTAHQNSKLNENWPELINIHEFHPIFIKFQKVGLSNNRTSGWKERNSLLFFN